MIAMPLCQTPSLSRRALLSAGGALFASATIPSFARAADARDPRLVVIILRGALDGLSAVAPIGDPDYAALHGELALRWDGEHPALALNSFFGLNPSMPNFARLYGAKQAIAVHACATNYRERSHFDGQDVLESGMPGPGQVDSGWLNRAIAALPKGERIATRGGLAVGATPPLVLRGGAPILGWAPSGLVAPTDDLTARLMALYAHRDPALGAALRQGLDAESMAMKQGMDGLKPGGDIALAMRRTAEGAARLIGADDGPRIAALAYDGWDTHANEGGATGRLAQLLGGLDGAIAAFESEMGPRWKDTIVVAITEFGRTVHINGTTGTDHGTGTVAFLAGGALDGGRVIADWPGLKTADLYEARDLKPTTDLRAVLKGLLADQFGLSAETLGRSVFPDTLGVRPMGGLAAA
jgi:uncharacterized protein (DUF1501 family)